MLSSCSAIPWLLIAFCHSLKPLQQVMLNFWQSAQLEALISPRISLLSFCSILIAFTAHREVLFCLFEFQK